MERIFDTASLKLKDDYKPFRNDLIVTFDAIEEKDGKTERVTKELRVEREQKQSPLQGIGEFTIIVRPAERFRHGANRFTVAEYPKLAKLVKELVGEKWKAMDEATPSSLTLSTVTFSGTLTMYVSVVFAMTLNGIDFAGKIRYEVKDGKLIRPGGSWSTTSIKEAGERGLVPSIFIRNRITEFVANAVEAEEMKHFKDDIVVATIKGNYELLRRAEQDLENAEHDVKRHAEEVKRLKAALDNERARKVIAEVVAEQKEEDVEG